MRRQLLALGLLMGGLLLYNEAQAKTAFLGHVSMSVAPTGPYNEWEFTGQPSFGAGVKLGMEGRFSFGLDYMGQAMEKSGWEYDRVLNDRGRDAIRIAEQLGMDISQFNIHPDDLLTYSTKTEDGTRHLVTGTLYINLVSENGSRLVVEPVIGAILGFAATQHRTNYEYFYHPVTTYLFGSDQPLPGDDGSGHSRQTKSEFKPVAGAAFGLNIFPVENFIISPEVRWLAGYGANFRVGTGVAF
ncbi:MAG: hypothetical protein V1794_13190 [Candidatus Glassbacteria bacterium]